MKIFILTQEEPFYLPQFFETFWEQLPAEIECVGISILAPFNTQKSWWGVIKDHFLFYGPEAFLHQGMLFAGYKVLDRIPFLRLGARHFFSVKACTKHYGVPFVHTQQVNGHEFREALKALEPDWILSIACPQILRTKTLAIPNQGALNLHSAKLPQYRGIAPLFWAMLNDEQEAAVSIHRINEKIDDGELLAQQTFAIEKQDTLHDLYLKVIQIGPRLMLGVLTQLLAGKAETRPNALELGSYFGFPDYQSGKAFRSKGHRFR